MNKWSNTSKARLDTCHPELIILANAVLPIHDCTVVCGFRSEADQMDAYNNKKSKVMWPHSKHNKTPSVAIDLAPYLASDPDLWDREQGLFFAGIVKGVAEMLYKSGAMSRKIRWGGDWDSDNNFKEHSFYDGVHFELVD